MRLAWGIIAAPSDKEAELLDKSLASFVGVVDKFFITITGKNKKVEEVARKYDAEISYFDWVDDFAAARNYNFSQIPNDYDWVGWSDCDDIILNPKKIKKVLELVPENAKSLAAKYNYDHDKYGNVTIDHWRERIIRKNSGYKWVGAIHETLIDPNYAPIIRTEDFVVSHQHEGGDAEKVGVRNLRILEKEIRKQKESGEEVDPRLVYYLAATYKTLGMYPEALQIFNSFVRLSGWDEQRFDAYLQMSDIGIQVKDKKVAVDNALLAMSERPDFPDAYFQLGKVYFSWEVWDKTILWIETGLKKKPTNTDWVITVRKPQALLYIATALTNSGKFKEANKYLNELLELWPKEKGIKKQIKINSDLEDQKEYVKSLLKLFKYNKNKKSGKNDLLLQSVPKEFKDNPAFLQMQWDLNPTHWSDKSIVIHCGDSFDEWHPGIVDKGIGGSEEAVIYLSKELTKLGWEVTVFNNCGNGAGEYDGVEYRNYWEFNPKDFYNILIGWRTPQFFERGYIAKKTYLWMHDVFPDDVWTKSVLANVDKVMCLSKYHRSLWPSLPEEKVFYTSNGINAEYYDKKGSHKKHRLIYSSCPSRGLEVLFDIWPEVKKEVPDAELHYFYGWNNWIKGNQNYKARMDWMEQMKDKSKQDGIFEHGRVGHKELIDEMYASDILAYPCIFPEISCITLMHAQATGLIPVIIPFAATDETCQYGYKTKSKKPEEGKKEYAKLLIKAMKEDFNREEMIDWAKDEFPWSKVSKVWDEEFKN